MRKEKKRWFAAGSKLGWEKSQGQATRRRNALKARSGDYLATGRALQALSNVNAGPKGDKETMRKAKSDAQYFFAQHRREKEKSKRR